MKSFVLLTLYFCAQAWGDPVSPVPLIEVSLVHMTLHTSLANPIYHFLAELDVAISPGPLDLTLKLSSPGWLACW